MKQKIIYIILANASTGHCFQIPISASRNKFQPKPMHSLPKANYAHFMSLGR